MFLKVRIIFNNAEVVKLVDAADSKSAGGNSMRVRFPPSANLKLLKESELLAEYPDQLRFPRLPVIIAIN